jgi:spore coat protein H
MQNFSNNREDLPEACPSMLIATLRPISLRTVALPWALLAGCTGDASHVVANTAEDPKTEVPESTEPVCTKDSPACSVDLFPEDALVTVALSLDEASVATLRGEGRSLNDVLTGCAPKDFAYTQFMADVVVDGVALGEVGLSKKGFLGSLSMRKPSLRVELDAFVDKQGTSGTSDLTLNNSLSDPTYLHQCLAYRLFVRAGFPASRCGFAQVTVNGQDFGTYVNVEPVKKPFLRAHFSDASGDLYEGTLADFHPVWLGGLEKKTNTSEPPSELLTGLADALLLEDDSAFLAALPDYLDVDGYFRFWAMESLLGHWDGYAGNNNNFFLYLDPSSGKLSFIPWGTDTTFTAGNPIVDASVKLPASVQAAARLPHRLYGIASSRARYQDTMRALLRDVWKEDVILADITRMADIVGDAADAKALDGLRKFVRSRRADIEAELDAAEAPRWEPPLRNAVICDAARSSAIRGTFETTFGDLDAATLSAASSLVGSVDGKPIPKGLMLVTAGSDVTNGGNALRFTVVGSDGALTVVQFLLGTDELVAGERMLHGVETFGVLLQGEGPEKLATTALVGGGSISFDEVGMAPGSSVKGHFEATLSSIVGPVSPD